jgi:hypothetical protein
MRPDSFVVGECLGDTYEIRRVVTRRGGVTEFEADDRALCRVVSVKASRDGAALRRQALALAAVQHPGLPAVYGFGTKWGIDYVVVERVHGITFAELFDQQRRADACMHVADALPILASLAEVLAAVHERGRAHGGLDASTVAWLPPERAILLEFGALDHPFEEARRRDVRAFAAVGFELLAGAAPVDDRDDVAAIRPDVPLAVADILRASLGGDARRRPTMAAVAYAMRTRPPRRPARRSAAADAIAG